MKHISSIIDNYLSEALYDNSRAYLKNILSELIIPNRLYHLTSRTRLPSILKHGLKVAQSHLGGLDMGRAYIQRGIYLTNDAHEVLIQSDIPNTAQLEINSRKLKRDKFELDPEFYVDEIPDENDLWLLRRNLKSKSLKLFLVYKDDIPVNAITRIDRKYDIFTDFDY